MEALYFFKMQIACLLVLGITGLHSLRCGVDNECNKTFDFLFVLSELEVIFDGFTVWSVNNPDKIPWKLNCFFHCIFFILLVTCIFLIFLYFLGITFGLPEKKWKKGLVFIPYLFVVIKIVFSMPELYIVSGKFTDYSMGAPAYWCFISGGLLWLGCFAILFTGFRFIEQHKRTSILICLLVSFICVLIQMIYPEVLLSSLGLTIIVFGIFVNLENPSYVKLLLDNKDMVANFSTIIENRDDSTGGHVKRTTLYVEIIMEEMRKMDSYKKVMTRDFMNFMMQAAPMHDIGKIGIPDAILQKPGKLTDEEFNEMKKHTIIGGEIIQETFGHKEEKKDFAEVAYKVCNFHHEKWNGKGYPEGLSGTDIPLCARIMAVADVFDAVSAKRCYRDALPLEKCFEIISSGRGTDFDPAIVDIFLNARPTVEKVYFKSFN